MRVIAGTYKGRQLKPVPHRQTRPTTDKVKEALFQVIGPFFNGGMCLDLFAGSGGLGIEALSRGMDRAVFVDKNQQAIQTIHFNLASLQLEEKTEVFRTDAFRALKAASKRELTFHLIFLDPPYAKLSYESLLEKISDLELLTPSGKVICEHEKHTTLPKEIAGFFIEKQEIYGSTTAITIYSRRE